MAIKEKITEAAERVYDLVKEGKYDVEMNLRKKDLKVKTKRQTAQNIKWRAKNR